METYRMINTVIALMSILIDFIILFYQFIYKRKAGKLHMWFTFIVLSNMMMNIGDIFDWSMGGTPGRVYSFLLWFFVCFVYNACSGLLLFSIFNWTIEIIRQKEGHLPKFLPIITSCLLGLQVILAATLPWHRLVYINNDNNYQRSAHFAYIALLPSLIYLITIITIIVYRRCFKRSEFPSIFLFLGIPLLAELVQLYTYKYSVLGVFVSLGLLVGFIFIQNQRKWDNELDEKQKITEESERLRDVKEFQENLSEQLIEALSSTVEAKDHYTRGHSIRVAQYACEIMYRLGGDEQAQKETYYIGILHDVGKISIPNEIINKKGKLTDEEYDQIKLHTIAGYQILRNIDVIPDLAIGARWHHERYDGKGYPNGLEGENIPLIARIISVADAYDAMTSNRSYHSVKPQSFVRQQIENGMGTQFDPKIAQIMLDMIDEDTRYEMKQVDNVRNRQILLIDDDEIVHKMVKAALAKDNYVLTSAYSGEEGIELLKENKYDLCILDMEMPGMNGFEVLEWIGTNVRMLKVVFLTGDKELATIKRSQELGAIDYITKPVNFNVLVASINSIFTF